MNFKRFPEEVAFRLTEVEYELFKQVHPIEYLRHATLDMNNFKYSLIAGDKKTHLNSSQLSKEKNVANESTATAASQSNNTVYKSVQDLIVRYKEVSSWIKKLIQSQATSDRRTAIILSAIRCAITCWNIGNFNSSREIWLGLK
jgi:phosphatidylinositol phospholipase C epsilon